MKWYNEDSCDIIFKIFFLKIFECPFCIATIYKLEAILQIFTPELGSEILTLLLEELTLDTGRN